MEVVSAQHSCPGIIISNNNGNWSPPLPITQNTLTTEDRKKRPIFQLFQYIGFCRFHLKNIWDVPKYKSALHSQLLGQKNPWNGSFKKLAFPT